MTVDALLQPLARHNDMLLETKRRDGTWVATPVNLVVENDHIFFRTWRESGKAKRLHNFSEVHVAPSDRRGHPLGGRLSGRATLLHDDDDRHASGLINRRFPVLQGIFVRLFHRLRRLRTQHYVIRELRIETAELGQL